MFDTMEKEIIYGQIVAKANHYLAVPGKDEQRRIIKDEVIREYERTFVEQCRIYKDRRISGRFTLIVDVFYKSARYDLDNSIKTLLDCLQMVNAITNDNLCFNLIANKYIDIHRPRVEFCIKENNAQGSLF